MKQIGTLSVLLIAIAAALWGATSLTTSGDIEVDNRILRGVADPPCFSDVDRYMDCGNGTVTDGVTNLIWLQDAACLELPGLGGLATGSYAVANVAASLLREGLCGLSDGSRPGDWRLPTDEEWQQTVKHATVILGCTPAGVGDPPALTNDEGTDCLAMGPTSFLNVPVGEGYWSSTTSGVEGFEAKNVGIGSGGVFSDDKGIGFSVWPVRDVR